MNQINPQKLLLSKWTSRSPRRKEKHFIVTELIKDNQDNIIECIIEAIFTHTQYIMSWHDLKSPENWQPGWK